MNVLQKSPEEVNQYIVTYITRHKVPEYKPNSGVSIDHDLRPLLGMFSNLKSYMTELYLITFTALQEQKKFKRTKDSRRNEAYYSDLEAKVECIHRTIYALDRSYESTSRMMTGVGEPDPRSSRHV